MEESLDLKSCNITVISDAASALDLALNKIMISFQSNQAQLGVPLFFQCRIPVDRWKPPRFILHCYVQMYRMHEDLGCLGQHLVPPLLVPYIQS